jgi:hypothetical protein
VIVLILSVLMLVTWWCQILLCCGGNAVPVCFYLPNGSLWHFTILVSLFTICIGYFILSNLFLINCSLQRDNALQYWWLDFRLTFWLICHDSFMRSRNFVLCIYVSFMKLYSWKERNRIWWLHPNIVKQLGQLWSFILMYTDCIICYGSPICRQHNYTQGTLTTSPMDYHSTWTIMGYISEYCRVFVSRHGIWIGKCTFRTLLIGLFCSNGRLLGICWCRIIFSVYCVNVFKKALHPGLKVRSCGICRGQSGTGAGFLRVLPFPLPLIPPTAPQSSSSGGGTIVQWWPQW